MMCVRSCQHNVIWVIHWQKMPDVLISKNIAEQTSAEMLCCDFRIPEFGLNVNINVHTLQKTMTLESLAIQQNICYNSFIINVITENEMPLEVNICSYLRS